MPTRKQDSSKISAGRKTPKVRLDLTTGRVGTSRFTQNTRRRVDGSVDQNPQRGSSIYIPS
eukprot:3379274-Rhodomonas_salina.1